MEFRWSRRTLRGRDHRRPHGQPHLQRLTTGDDRRRAAEESGCRRDRQPLRQRHSRRLRGAAWDQDLPGPAIVRRPPGRSAGIDDMSYTHPDSMRDHVAIITGAAQGVGKGIAAALLDRGAAVFLVDIQDEKLAATTEELDVEDRK